MEQERNSMNASNLVINQAKSLKTNGGFLKVLFVSFIMGIGFNLSFSYFFDSPEEIILKKQNKELQTKLYAIGYRMDSIDNYLAHIQQKDDYLYRMLLNEKPLEKEIRMAGIGGAGYFATLSSYITPTDLERVEARLAVQMSSLNELTHKAEKIVKEYACLPQISPILQTDLIRFTSGFGTRNHPIYHLEKFHKGIDLTANKGTSVYATSKGKVVIASNQADGYGNKVVIDHGNGIKTVYAHLSKILVKAGQEVNLAQEIGKVGNSGRSIASHLHYELRRNDEPIDPTPFLDWDFSEEEYKALADGN
jgi:murein DD-endopeptidase MepM/ murein hydrolase activator NlpD